MSSPAAETSLEPPGDENGRRDGGQLEQPERGRGAEVEEPCGLVVDLRLERRVARSSEHDDHAEGREAEEEHDRGGGCERRCQQRSRDADLAVDGRGAERRRRIPQALVQPRPERADDANDDSDVEEHVREKDRPDRALDPVGEQRDERRRHDDGRQHERHEYERLDDRSAAEPEPRQRPGEREARDEREHRGHGRLPEREPGDLAGRAPGQHVEWEIDRAVDDEASLEDRCERPAEEDREERER